MLLCLIKEGRWILRISLPKMRCSWDQNWWNESCLMIHNSCVGQDMIFSYHNHNLLWRKFSVDKLVWPGFSMWTTFYHWNFTDQSRGGGNDWFSKFSVQCKPKKRLHSFSPSYCCKSYIPFFILFQGLFMGFSKGCFKGFPIIKLGCLMGGLMVSKVILKSF